MAVKLEGKHPGEYLVSELNGSASREVVTIASGRKLSGCTVLALLTVGAAVAAAVAGNTGNGTFSAVTVGTGAVTGVYRAIAIAATKFTIEDPSGHELGVATAGVAFNSGGLTFTITAGGTPFVAGDSFTITTAAGSGKAVALNPAGVDGSAVPYGILYETTDATTADKKATAHVRHCEVNASDLVWPDGFTTNQIAAATAQLLTRGIISRLAI